MKMHLFRGVVFLPILLLLMFSVCDIERSNPLDSSGDNFEAPQILIDTTGLNLANGDTIHSRSAMITVIGNRAESRFQVQIDTGSILEWQSSGVFHFNALNDGNHSVYVHSKYEGGVYIVNDTVNFFVQASGYVPEFISVTDSVINIAKGESVTIIAKAKGLSPISYSWIKNDTLIPLVNTDTLVLSNVQHQDSGSYRCIASNEWGSCTSRLFKIKIGQVSTSTFTVIYDGNENSSGTAPIDLHLYEKGGVVTVKGNVGDLARTGYKFVGWNTARDGLGTSYAPGIDFYIGSTNLKLFANWTQSATYSVRYNGNGSDSDNVPVDINNYTSGATVTAKGNLKNLTKSGFTFAGWNTDSDGKGISYAAGVEFKIVANDVVLYAKWTQSSTYRVEYDGNGNTSGDIPIDENVYERGASVIVKSFGNLIKPGYVFVGWNTAMDGIGIPFTVGTEFNIGSYNMKLFANWTQNPTCTVSYHGNGNSKGIVPIDVNAYEQRTLAIVKGNTGGLEKIGYVFAGWNTMEDGSGITYAAGVEFNIGLSNKELFAKWTQNVTYTVTYNGNGNSGGSAPIDANAYEQNASVVLKGNTGNLVRPGYTFTGWNTTEDGRGISYAAGVEFIISSENVVLFANWTQSSTYTIVYNSNGSTSGTVPIDINDYKDGAPVIVKGNIGNLNKSGFSFVGWNTSVDGHGISYAAGVEFNIGHENVILFANWTQSSTYKVVYNGNGNTSGNIPIDVNVYEKGAVVTVKGNSGNLLKTGFTFAGWNTAADGKGVAYAAGVEFNLASDNVVLYAHWTQNETFGVYYIANGSNSGNIPVDPNMYEKGSKVTIKGNIGNLSRLGFTFAGWNTSSAGNGVSYAAGIEISMPSASLTLYAYWTQNTTYLVTYNGNGNTGGSVPIDANKYELGAAVKVKSNTGGLVKAGYTFAGWNSAANGSGTFYAIGVDFNMGSGNIVLYAKWTQNPTFKVTYNGNGNSTGSVPVDANAYEKGASITVKGNTGNLGKTGYVFAGWNTLANGTGASYASDVKIIMGSGDIVLFANWTQNPTHKIIYIGNGNTSGSVPIDANAYKKDDTVIVKGNTGNLTRIDYLFVGWNVAAAGTGASFTTGAKTIMSTSDITLYAQWTMNQTYKITYNGNNNTDGNVPKDSTLYEKGATVNILGNTGSLVRAGYSFAGWNLDTAGNAKTYNAGDTFIIGSSSEVLFAKWKLIPTFNVSYSGNGYTSGAVPTDAVAYLQGDSVSVKGNETLAKTGFTFTKWNTLADGTGITYVSEAKFKIGSANVVLYAIWAQNQTYTVSYNGNGNTSGLPPTDAAAYLQGDSVTVKDIGTMINTGSTFTKWNTLADGTGITYNSGTKFKIGSTNVVLYAIWTQNPTFTVSYNGNGNSSGAVPTDGLTYLQGDSVTVQGNTGLLIKNDSIFKAWNTIANGTGIAYASGAKFKIGSANVVLYATWALNPTFSVSYNGNGNTSGIVPIDAVAYLQGETVTVVGNTGLLVRKGHTFAGWNTSIDGTGVSYPIDTKFNIGTANVLLYAQWTVDVYSINYNLDGGTDDNPTSYSITSPAITLKKPAKLGFTFVGWFTNPDMTTEAFSIPSGSTGNKEFWAKWSLILTFNVDYNSNGGDDVISGTVPVDTHKYQKDSVVIIKSTTSTLERSGYVFKGWTTEPNGSGNILVTGSTLIMGTSDITLYAKWNVTYKIIYSSSNSSGAVPVDSKNYEQGSIAIVANQGQLTKTNYDFTGWNAVALGGMKTYHPGDTLHMRPDLILTATWYPKSNFVFYIEKIGNVTVPVDTDMVVVSGTVNIKDYKGSGRTGYTFAGWTMAEDGSGSILAAGSPLTMGTSDITLYAKWIEIFKVTFDGGEDAKNIPASIDVIYPARTVGLLPSPPKKAGYKFEGWWTTTDESGLSFTGSTVVNANLRVYAKWIENDPVVGQ